MSIYEGMLISKILSTKDFYLHKKYNITEDDFSIYKDIYKYIEAYVKNNSDSFPSIDLISDKFSNFDYDVDVTDSFMIICKELKANRARRELYELLQNKVSDKFDKLDGHEFLEWINNNIQEIKNNTEYSNNNGIDWANNGEERFKKFNHIKQHGKTVIPTPYKTLNNLLDGGNDLGDYVLLQGYTNTGKSWIATHFGLTAWEHNFGVLHYSPEISEYQQTVRLDSLKGSYDAKQLSNGNIEGDIVSYYEQFKNNKTPYIIRSMENIDGLFDISLIERDLENNNNIGMVIIDGFTLMSHKGSGSNRDKMATTSRRLRQLFSKYNVVGIVVHQTPTSARKENEDFNDDGIRLPSPAKIYQYSETIAVIQDACTVLSWDSSYGIGKILIAKAKKPCVDEEVDIILDYSKGYIRDKNVIATSMDFGF